MGRGKETAGKEKDRSRLGVGPREGEERERE